MRKRILFILLPIYAYSMLLIIACTKDNDKVNKPEIIISHPTIGQEIIKGETVGIVATESNVEVQFLTVQFFVDEIEKWETGRKPYKYNWLTKSENFGDHTLKVTMSDTNGVIATSSIIVVKITEGINDTNNFTDYRDGQIYKIIAIGNQIWFAENLNYEMDNSWWFDNYSSNGDIYGRLYNWNAALTACPNGWHLPTDEEFKTLEMELGMSQSEVDERGFRGTNEGSKMKSTEGWEEFGNGINSSGFSALPGGFRFSYGVFILIQKEGYWRSATEYD